MKTSQLFFCFLSIVMSTKVLAFQCESGYIKSLTTGAEKDFDKVSVQLVDRDGNILNNVYTGKNYFLLNYNEDLNNDVGEVNLESLESIFLNGYLVTLSDTRYGGCLEFNTVSFSKRRQPIKLNKIEALCDSEKKSLNAAKKPSYPVGFLPWLGDWKRAILNGGPYLRYYDPSEIEGVGILTTVINGKLYGDSLKKKKCEKLRAYPKRNGAYSWVLVPDGNIVYKWNSRLALDARSYTRHSDLNRGKPVVCGGEFYLDYQMEGPGIDKLYIELNDSSGHYKPDGKDCMPYVLTEFRRLGVDIDSSNVLVRTR